MIVRLLLIMSSCVVAQQSAGADPTWAAVALMNIPRQETAAARIGHRVYVVGGLLDGGPVTAANTVEVYDAEADTWTFVAPMPLGLDHAAAAALDGKLYVIGGFSRSAAGTAKSEAGVYIYDPELDAWSTGTSLPEPRGAPWAVTHRGKIYVAGGLHIGAGLSDSIFIFDPHANTWDRGADMPTAREHLNAVSCGDYIYVIGGRAGGTAFDHNERYDPVQDTWSVMAPMPTARSAMFMATWGSRIYCGGGEIPMLFDVMEVYDAVTGEWSAMAPMAVPRHGLPATPLPGGILAPGGGVVQGLEPTAYADIFVPGTAAEDLDNSGGVGAADVQLAINGALGIPLGTRHGDIDGNGHIDAPDVQSVINAALAL